VGADASEQDSLLWEIERCGLRERLRLMLIWILLARGDPEFMMVGAVGMYLPNIEHARRLLAEAEGGVHNLSPQPTTHLIHCTRVKHPYSLQSYYISCRASFL